MKSIAPLPLRKLQSQMALKGLSLAAVAAIAQVPYATASQILNGRLINPPRLAKLRKAINAAPMPEEAAA